MENGEDLCWQTHHSRVAEGRSLNREGSNREKCGTSGQKDIRTGNIVGMVHNVCRGNTIIFKVRKG